MAWRIGALALGLVCLFGCERDRYQGNDDDTTCDTGVFVDTETEDPEPRDNWNPEWISLEEQVLLLVNEARSETQRCGDRTMSPASPLEMHPLLRDVARAHSKDMSDRNFFDHVNPDGDSPFDRLDAAGWSSGLAGENIAFGHPTAEAVMEGWMNSPGHCQNIMEPGFRWIGVGLYDGFWTQVFGG